MLYYPRYCTGCYKFLLTLPQSTKSNMLQLQKELFLAPTFDFIMRLLSAGAMIEVISPESLRKTLKGWVSDMYNLYKND